MSQAYNLTPRHASFTYSQLLVKVCQLANALKEEGVKKGDRVSVYLPMVVADAAFNR